MENNFKKLISKIESVYGMPVHYGQQCHGLSEAIYQSTQQKISWQTLRRAFGFIKTNSKPSKFVLDVLSKYCGFVSYSQFCQNECQIEKADNKDLEYLFLSSVYNMPYRFENDLTYHLITKNIAESFYNNKHYIDKYAPFLIRNINAKLFFFERFPFIDLLNYKPYFNLLKKLKAQYPQDVSTAIFVDTIETFVNYLINKSPIKKGDYYKYKTHIYKLHPFLAARLIGSKLLETSVSSKEIIKEIELLGTFYAKEDAMHFPFFYYMIADYLNLAGMHNEVIYFYEQALKKSNTKPSGWVEVGYHETFDLLYAISLFYTGNKRKASLIFGRIKIENFNFIFKKYYQIKYIHLSLLIKNHEHKRKENRDLLSQLIEETGFIRFI